MYRLALFAARYCSSCLPRTPNYPAQSPIPPAAQCQAHESVWRMPTLPQPAPFPPTARRVQRPSPAARPLQHHSRGKRLQDRPPEWRRTVEVDQRARLDFALAIGSNTEIITVEGSAPLLNTSDASVSTVIGNRFVENMPLNGRSFSSLIDLTPGVVSDAVQFLRAGPVQREWPAAGCKLLPGGWSERQSWQRGKLAISLHQGGAGQLPATSAFGGTSNLVSLDALEEFRIQTSTFAPEYGRTPGAQISVVTKSGTNTFHGTAFEYFRNDKLDANDWFANAQRAGEARTSAERFRRRAGRADQERQAVLLRFLRGAEGAPASGGEYVRANGGHASECACRGPAAAQCLPVAERP